MSSADGIPYKIGLTGAIGAGKSTVADVWKSLGAVVVEGDQMGRLTLSNPTIIRRLTEQYGVGILDVNEGTINRRALSKAAFSTPAGARELTAITFPELYRLANERVKIAVDQKRIVVYDAALIYEWGVESDFDCIVVVTAPLNKIYERSAGKLNITTIEVQNRIAAQLPVEEKVRKADRVINNVGSLARLKREAAIVWDELKTRV